MITRQEQRTITRLVKAVAGRMQTEDLLRFVARYDGMLECCLKLASPIRVTDREFRNWVERECRRSGIELRHLEREASRICAIFNPSSTGDDHYRALGLMSGAPTSEVKRAYRRLCRRYHPDASGDRGEDVNKFHEISASYHCIMAERKQGRPDGFHPVPWLYRDLTPTADRHGRRTLLFLGIVTAIFLIASFVASSLYDRMVLLKQFAPRGAEHSSSKSIGADVEGKQAPDDVEAVENEKLPLAAPP